MAFTNLANGRIKAEINVTPMIDVLLVLLIIFMVIAPHTFGLEAGIPQPSTAAPADLSVLVTINGGGAIHLDEEAVAPADVRSRLAALFGARGNTTLFVKADPSLTFDSITQFIDAAKGVGFNRVGLQPREP
jgi:biopolymer transport protein ExbD